MTLLIQNLFHNIDLRPACVLSINPPLSSVRDIVCRRVALFNNHQTPSPSAFSSPSAGLGKQVQEPDQYAFRARTGVAVNSSSAVSHFRFLETIR